MSPEQLASVNAEHSHQRALFAWCNIAERFGFDLAWDERTYETGALAQFVEGGCNAHMAMPVPELKWFHAIPNGGPRDAITAGKLKVEGVKKGVLDCFLPLPMEEPKNSNFATLTTYCGLYIELKRPKTEKEGVRKARIIDQQGGTLSPEQTEFVAYARGVGYAVSVCYHWRSAADDLQSYIEAVRNSR